jgi:uncharacterized protein
MFIRVVLVSLLLLTSLAAQEAKSPATPSKQATAIAPENKIDPAKEADIRHLMSVTQMDKVTLQTMQKMATTIKPLITASLPAGEYREKLVGLFLEKFEAKAKAEDFIGLVVPLYDKYFTDDEIKGLIKFYETPLGQKAVSSLPQLVSEAQSIGQKWGGRLGQESMQEVFAEHPELKQAMEDAAVKAKMQ